MQCRFKVPTPDRLTNREHPQLVSQLVSCTRCHVWWAGRHLDQWIWEHWHAVESGDCSNSTLTEHAWRWHHSMNWDNTRVLDPYQRLIPDVVHIGSQSNLLNTAQCLRFTTHYCRLACLPSDKSYPVNFVFNWITFQEYFVLSLLFLYCTILLPVLGY